MMHNKHLLDGMSASYTHWDLELQLIIIQHEDAVLKNIHYLISNHFHLKLIKNLNKKLDKLMSNYMIHMYQLLDDPGPSLMMR